MTRRGPHEGSVYQAVDGRWVAALHLGYEGGKRKRKVYFGRTRREAQQKLVAAQRDLQTGILPSNEKLTLASFLDQWIQDVAPTLRPRTHERYRQILTLHVIPTLGRTPVARLTPQQVQALVNAKIETGLAPATVVYVRAVLRRALTYAVRWGLAPRNVAALVDPPRVTRREVRPLSPDEARALLDAVRGDRLEALYAVALALGLREGEAFGLQWDDIDFENATLTVRHALLRMTGRLELVEPKTARSRRTIALPSRIVAALRAHRARQLEERLIAGAGWQDWGLVFATEIGSPLHRADVLRALHRHLAAAGLPPMRFHDLRHACASLLLAQGVHPRVVMETLGHSNIGQTMDTYTHVLPTLQRDAASRMDDVLGG
jgi:integrase